MADEDPFAGKGDQAIGKGKEFAGKAVGDEELEAEGKAQHAGGKVHEAAHDIKEKVKGAVSKVTHHDHEETGGRDT